MTVKLNTQQFIQRAKEVHGDFYDYSLTEYTKSKMKVTVICPIHGNFEQLPYDHLKGRGCWRCSNTNNSRSRRMTNDEFINKAREIHDDKYDYSNVDLSHSLNKITITCPVHGKFEQRLYDHLYGRGCPYCGIDAVANSQYLTGEEFTEKAKTVHGDFYDYSKVEYVRSKSKVTITCPNHGDFEQKPNDHLNGAGCLKCAIPGPSKKEQSVNDFVESLGLYTIQSDRTTIKPKELDIMLPDKKIAIEFNGLYWHSEKFTDKNYHLDKLNEVNEQGYQLIQIFEDEWDNNKQLIKEKLAHLLGYSELKLYARQCTIQTPSKQEKKELYENNHIQGSIGTGIDLGLYYEDELVACLSFTDKGDGVYDLVRYATAINVVGGFSKLLSHFKKNYEWSIIYTFADKRWSTGNLYLKNGFTHVYDTKPNYWYVNEFQRENRIKYQKHKLHKVLDIFDPELTEVQNCNNNDLYRIFDCGHMKFEMRNK